MEVILNGEKLKLSEEIVCVSDLLEYYKLLDKVVIIEVNGEILNKVDHQETLLSDRDRIEIVHFVGGG